ALYPFMRATINMIVYLVGGFIILCLRFNDANILSALLTVVLMVIVMGSIGILAASFTLVFKQGDPFTALLVLASGMLSGTMYPVGVLPEWLQGVARLLPQTHAIEAIRIAILRGGSLSEVAPQLIVLALFAALLVPLALLVFSAAMNRARIEGSLAHY
ncbi:MAG: ABC transporter permease, partial [Bacteroidetes bacterium]|nr:ABC transporter permease [Bacteroidota bacterium]